MADIATVLRKTIDGLPRSNPDIRQKVYAKARAAILARLEAKEPEPDQATIDKQMAGVDRIIAAVESEYAFNDQLNDVLGEPAAAPSTQPEPAPPPPASPPPVTSEPPAIDPAAPDLDGAQPASASAETPREEAPPEAAEHQAPTGDAGETRRQAAAQPAGRDRRGAGLGALAWALAVILIAGAGGYAAWVNQDALRAQFARLTASTGDEGGSPTTPAADQPDDAEPTADAPAAATQENGTSAADETDAKFTQRLLPDGTEVDTGAAEGKPAVGEGTSVAQLSQPQSTVTEGGEGEPSAAGPSAEDGEAGSGTGEPQAIPVGQRAIFYEERTSTDQETALQGGVVWSQVEESPGEGAPREPAIRADVSVADKGLTLRMTIRRNTDETLPASHIIELVFVTPENFAGGAVDDVLRVAFKDTEQSAGNPLLGLPVKIDDGLFLYALTDGAAEIETNTTLMRRQSWIDVTILYRTGRRALITMEKGIPGSAVFDEVLKSWSAAADTGG